MTQAVLKQIIRFDEWLKHKQVYSESIHDSNHIRSKS